MLIHSLYVVGALGLAAHASCGWWPRNFGWGSPIHGRPRAVHRRPGSPTTDWHDALYPSADEALAAVDQGYRVALPGQRHSGLQGDVAQADHEPEAAVSKLALRPGSTGSVVSYFDPLDLPLLTLDSTA
jgi:hypothetical protein